MGARIPLERLTGGEPGVPQAPLREVRLHTQQGIPFRLIAAYLAAAVITGLPRYFVIACGRRWGKTILGCVALVTAAAERPGRYWYVAPTQKDARDIAWRQLVALVPRSWLKKNPNETRLEIELVNGALISLKGADDPDSLRGRGLSGVVVDEYADIKANLWDEVLAPALLDKDGWCVFLGTPKGYDHFYDLFLQGQNDAFPQWASWQFKTADAPHIRRRWDTFLELRRQYEQRGQLRLFKQEFEASFDSNAGYILGSLWEPSHTVTVEDVALLKQGYAVGAILPWHVIDDARWVPPSSATTWGSVDYGFGAPWSYHQHAGLTDGHTRTFAELYEREVPDWDQARRIKASIEALEKRGVKRPEWIVLDPSMWNSRKEEGKSKSIAAVYDEELGVPLNIPLIPGSAGRPARLSRPQRWMSALSVAADGFPFHSITTACPHMIRTVPRVPWDKDDPEVEDDASENHAYEDGGRFFEARPHTPSPAKEDPLKDLDPISRRHHQQREAARKPSGLKVQNFRVG